MGPTTLIDGPTQLGQETLLLKEPSTVLSRSLDLGHNITTSNRYAALLDYPLMDEINAIQYTTSPKASFSPPINSISNLKEACLHGKGSSHIVDEAALPSGEISPYQSHASNVLQLTKIEVHEKWSIEEVQPLNMQFLEAEMHASLWVHKNILKMRKVFRVNFEGYEEEALLLFMKIDR